MMVDVTYQMVLSTIQTAGILVGIAYYIMTLNYTRKNQEMQLETRQTQLFMYLYDKWSSEDFQKKITELQLTNWDDYEDWNSKYGPSADLDTYSRMTSLGSFYEGLGVLVKNGQVKPELVDELMSHSLISAWEKIAPIIIHQRKKFNYPNMGEWMEYLYNQIKPIYDKQHPELAP
ncbi:hypothetical protein E4G67_04245 [Candidatus Bathyarchaeota archaeon]|nr:MAG: hypothetical protein E4G67_04245 [Candidatus Bathyarchaeota archaeon]